MRSGGSATVSAPPASPHTAAEKAATLNWLTKTDQKPRPGVVHDETETFITTYAAIDPLRSAGRTVTLDGFFGWPLTAHAS